jgi:hypothetical protein
VDGERHEPGGLVDRLFSAIERQTDAVVEELRANRRELRVFVALVALAMILLASVRGVGVTAGPGHVETTPAATATTAATTEP